MALTANDIPAQLKLTTGMIDAAPSPPYPALVLQIFRDAKYMLDVRVAPLIGALVVTNDAWNKIERRPIRPIVLAAAQGIREAAARRRAEARRRLGRDHEDARPDRDDARSEGAGGVPRRGREARDDDARQHGARPTSTTWPCSERDAFRKTKGK